MDQVVLDSKTYVSSKRAATDFGYTQDYVGQLCRAGHIEARRISGQWYVFLESLQAYKSKAENFKPEPPKYQPDPNVEATLREDGKEFVSAALASKITDYNQDYVGQLARAGKIPSKQIGNRWYVDRNAILEHKKEKDALLRAVQAESVGLKKVEKVFEIQKTIPQIKTNNDLPILKYAAEAKPLFPELADEIGEISLTAKLPEEVNEIKQTPKASRIPIKVMKTESVNLGSAYSNPETGRSQTTKVRINKSRQPGKSIFSGIFSLVAVSVLFVFIAAVVADKQKGIYAILTNSTEAQTAAANQSSASYMDSILTRELVYTRY